MYFERTTYPLSLKDFSWEFVSLLGSPLVSDATASNSSNGGSVNRSFKLIGLFFRLLTLFCELDVVTTAVEDIGWGRAEEREERYKLLFYRSWSLVDDPRRLLYKSGIA